MIVYLKYEKEPFLLQDCRAQCSGNVTFESKRKNVVKFGIHSKFKSISGLKRKTKHCLIRKESLHNKNSGGSGKILRGVTSTWVGRCLS